MSVIKVSEDAVGGGDERADEYLVDPKVSLLCQQQVGNALEIVLLKRDDVLFGQAVARRLGITHADLECLDMIFVRGRVTAGEISAASGLTTGAVTGRTRAINSRS